VILGGSVVVLAFIVVPLVSSVPDPLDPRRFALFGIPAATLARGLAIAGAVSVPVVLTLVAAVFTVPVWSENAATTLLAVLAALIAVATIVLASRVAALIAAVGLSTRRSRETAGLITVLLIVLASPAVVLWFSVNWGRVSSAPRQMPSAGAPWAPHGLCRPTSPRASPAVR
jgi:ABC-2 type transport system permease protein